MALERVGASAALPAPGRMLIEPRRGALDAAEKRLAAAMPVRLERSRHRLDALAASLRALDPSSVMDRGYAVVRQGERVVSRSSGVDGSVPLRVCFSDGELTADVTAITAKDGAR